MIRPMLSKAFRTLGSLLLSLVFILTIAFFIKNASQQFPDEKQVSYTSGFADFTSVANKRKQIIAYGKEQQLDIPTFYFSLRPSHFPASIHKILPLREQKAVRQLLNEQLQGDLLFSWRQKIIHQLDTASMASAAVLLPLLQSNSRADLEKSVRLASEAGIDLPTETSALLGESADAHWPVFHWHGMQNEWHLTASNFLSGQWGISTIDGLSVSTKIKAALPYTLLLNGSALLLLFLTALVVGSWWAQSEDSFWTAGTKQLSYFLYVMPLFWIAALAIAFLTQPKGVFPLASGLDNQISLLNFLLPLLCIWLSSFGYLSRMFEDKLRNEWEKPYIKLARHRGIPERKLLFSYALPNAIIPIITLLGAAFPALISGSLVIEVLFNIPGMGRLIWWSLQEQDWPVVINIILIIGLFAWLGRWGADKWSQKLDPRLVWSEGKV